MKPGQRGTVNMLGHNDKGKIAVIGIGKLGAAIAKFLVKRGFRVLVFDKYKRVKIRGAENAKSLKSAVGSADMVILSVSLANTQEVLAELSKILKPAQILVELAGVKTPFAATLRKMPCKAVSLHPLFGDFESLEGKNVIIVKNKDAALEKSASRHLKKFGANVIFMRTEEHDRIMAQRQLPAYVLSKLFYEIAGNIPLDALTPMMKKHQELAKEVLSEWPLYDSMLKLNPHSRKMIERTEKQLKKMKRKYSKRQNQK